MKTIKVYLVIVAIAAIFFAACKKSDSSVTPTVANLTGTFALKSDVWTSGGISANVYDSFPSCERDNLIKFNTDLTVNYTDAGTICSPNESSIGSWYLSNDSLYTLLPGNESVAKIISYNGTTLVLRGYPGFIGSFDSSIVAVSTYQKVN